MNLYVIIPLGIFLGFSMAAPPGPINSLMMERSIKSQFDGSKIGLGAMTADFIFMVLIFAFQKTVNFSYFLPIIYLAGALVFVYIAINMKFHSEEPKSNINTFYGYFKGLGTGLVNPYQIIWWLSAGLAIFETFGYTLFYFFFIGILIWIISITTLVHYSYMKYGEVLKRIITDFSSIVLLIFSAIFIYEEFLIFHLFT